MKIIQLTNDTKQNLLETLLKRSTNDYGDYEKVVAEIGRASWRERVCQYV